MASRSPSSIPIFPLKNTVLFPQLFVPLAATRPQSLAAIDAALLSEDKTILIISQRDASMDVPDIKDLYSVGSLAVIKKSVRSEGRMNLMVQGAQRVRLMSIDQYDPYLKGKFIPYPNEPGDQIEIEALRRSLIDLASRIADLLGQHGTSDLEQLITQSSNPLLLAYLLATVLSLSVEKQQEILEAFTVEETLRLLYRAMTEEIQILEVRKKIADHARVEIDKQQREYVLRQQLQAIQEELGENAADKSSAQEMRKRFQNAFLPEEVKKEVEREMRRLESLPLAAPDYHMTRTYIEFILDLPWEKKPLAPINLQFAEQTLNEDHYDLKDVKDRILEHLAVLKLNPHAKAPILCLVGPPGVGKTSLGQSIAHALDRKFERMSLGGLHDESELRGHRRTYIGAMPGRILQAIRRAGANNPLMMLDEVDKIGHDFRGDPAAALLEILDPAQNHLFRDNYLDLPFDLSNIFFITTANTVDTIPPALLDRMEILKLSGYTAEEKRHIAYRYLIPRRLRESGLKEEDLHFKESALKHIVTGYTHEAGVRELERLIGRIAAKVARQRAEGNLQPVILEEGSLQSYLGPKKEHFEMVRQELPAGVSVGLAWTPMGGEILYIEASLLQGSEELRLTGQLGGVMQESAKAAQTYLWSHALEWGIDPRRFHQSGIHIHVPSGAIPKDGPSAGLAMVSALASAYTGIPCQPRTGMTGEITLSGLVLPVGGIKEKILAARRAGIIRVVLPEANKGDLEQVSDEAKSDMNLIFVERIDLALPQILENSHLRIHRAA